MKKDLLKEYVREVIVQEKKSFGFGHLGKAAKDIFGSKKASSGPQKWFEKFMGRQLDKLGKDFSTLISRLIPEERWEKILSSGSKDLSREQVEDDLAHVVSAWIEEIEDLKDKKVSSKKKKEILEFAVSAFEKFMNKYDGDEKKSLIQVKRMLDMKYSNVFVDEKSK